MHPCPPAIPPVAARKAVRRRQRRAAGEKYASSLATLARVDTAQIWDPASYAKNARFVSDLGSPVLGLLAPKPGERILDLGCGDGVLTEKIADIGCEVVAIDSSTAFIESARRLGLNAHVVDAVALPLSRGIRRCF